LGLLIGVAQSEVATLLNVNFQNLTLLALLSIALIVKPSGVFGRGGLRAV
jgi:branched-subunit amino acid ABC-type transport system permease component